MRTIILPHSAALVDILRRRKADAICQWIFPDPVKPERSRRSQCSLSPHENAAPAGRGCQHPLHDLRHTFATHALTSGVDAKTLSGILGHTNASFTRMHLHPCHLRYAKQACGIVGSFMERYLRKGVETVARKRKAGTEP